MFIETQPPTNLRPRYKSDGTRQIEKSRTKPMVIKVCSFFVCFLNLFCSLVTKFKKCSIRS
jgi:hypothetical protein